jgi:hypothetical protein
MTALGFGMTGMEERICQVVRDLAGRFDEITYMEIGVGEGTTLTGIARELRMTKKKWRAIGLELPNGYSFDRLRTMEIAARRSLPLTFVHPETIVYPAWERVIVYFKDSQSFLTEHWNAPIHLALIDGCHGKPCVTADFIALEAFMADQGIVMFHDFSEDQSGHPQPHCAGGCDVRGACRDLGLLSDRRAGWRFTEAIPADRTNGGWDMGVFTKQPLKNG